MIAFYSDINGNDDIYVVRAETVRPKLLLSDPEHDLRVSSYSPDGRKVVYSSESDDKTGELKILDLEKQTTSLVRKTELPVVSADWSLDGNWIVFADRVNGNSEVLLVKPEGGELRNLTNDPAPDSNPSFSPDGNRIVFLSGRGEPPGTMQLFVMNADGSNPRAITHRKGFEGDPAWVSNNQIIFVCDRLDSPGNLLDICQINVDGSGEKRVLYHRDHDYRPAVSPDGDRIAFSASSDGNIEIYLMNSDGSGLVRLTRDPANDAWPQWSPDGKTLTFISNRGGKFAIYEVSVP
jgi:Tol biopolymer transport system component